MTKPNLSNIIQIPESTIREALQYIPENEESGMRTVLKAGEEYKAANMTPVFIMDKYNMSIYVVAAETFGKKLH